MLCAQWSFVRQNRCLRAWERAKPHDGPGPRPWNSMLNGLVIDVLDWMCAVHLGSATDVGVFNFDFIIINFHARSAPFAV